jgi:hypothetical protein
MEQRPQATEDHHHDLTAITSLSPVSTAGGHEHGTPEPASSQPAAGIKRRLQLSSNRLLSLDLLRGLAILLMITCNAQVGDNVFPILCKSSIQKLSNELLSKNDVRFELGPEILASLSF